MPEAAQRITAGWRRSWRTSKGHGSCELFALEVAKTNLWCWIGQKRYRKAWDLVGLFDTSWVLFMSIKWTWVSIAGSMPRFGRPSALQEAARSAHWEVVRLCGGVGGCQSGTFGAARDHWMTVGWWLDEPVMWTKHTICLCRQNRITYSFRYVHGKWWSPSEVARANAMQCNAM